MIQNSGIQFRKRLFEMCPKKRCGFTALIMRSQSHMHGDDLRRLPRGKHVKHLLRWRSKLKIHCTICGIGIAIFMKHNILLLKSTSDLETARGVVWRSLCIHPSRAPSPPVSAVCRLPAVCLPSSSGTVVCDQSALSAGRQG